MWETVWSKIDTLSRRVYQEVETLKADLDRNQLKETADSNIRKLGETLFQMREKDLSVLKNNPEILGLVDLLKNDHFKKIQIDQGTNGHLLKYYNRFYRWINTL
ncbi:MAG: hypothetical protein AAB317_03525 [Nitrospirota bacterium]|mgnify:CR=1 FL=1